VARLLLGLIGRIPPGADIQVISVNGALGLGVVTDGQLITVASLTTASGRITRVDLVLAPGKLPALP
jgi:RNA polymerase sigma-70 factor (ECF subfamily)